uniref:Ribos_L4_asso_C domain-containing protein n=1 Tax=Macrostomum lignano TaxID=282301 RepID=A0A1I8FTK0_9PLAT
PLAAAPLPGRQVIASRKISEVPLVVSDSVQDLKKTKEAVAFLKRVKAWPDIQKVYASQRFRAGRARIQKRGPLVIYAKDNGLCRAFRNIPGVTLICPVKPVETGPWRSPGRFVIWSESAFRQLDQIYAKSKLPDNKMASTDLTGILRSDEVKAAVRPRQARQSSGCAQKESFEECERRLFWLSGKALAKKRKADAPASSQKQQQKKQPAAKKAKQAAVKGKAVKK